MPEPLSLSAFELVLGVSTLCAVAAIAYSFVLAARNRLPWRIAVIGALISIFVPVVGPVAVVATVFRRRLRPGGLQFAAASQTTQ